MHIAVSFIAILAMSWNIAKSMGHCTSAVMKKYSASSGQHLRINKKTFHAVVATIHQCNGLPATMSAIQATTSQ